MPDFAYIARDLSGSKISGTISAASEREAVSLLSGKSLFPIDVAEEKEAVGFSFGGGVSGQLMAMTYSQMAALLRSGEVLVGQRFGHVCPIMPLIGRYDIF